MAAETAPAVGTVPMAGRTAVGVALGAALDVGFGLGFK